jgi:hypothetical protein
VITSLIQSAKLNGLDPYAYLKDVLEHAARDRDRPPVGGWQAEWEAYVRYGRPVRFVPNLLEVTVSAASDAACAATLERRRVARWPLEASLPLRPRRSRPPSHNR